MNLMKRIEKQLRQEQKSKKKVIDLLGIEFVINPVDTFEKECKQLEEEIEDALQTTSTYRKLKNKIKLLNEAIWIAETELSLTAAQINSMTDVLDSLEQELEYRFDFILD